MKNSLKILVGSLMILGLTACGGGGGSSDPGTSATAGILGNGTAGYLGKGDWSGNLTGQNVGSQQYQMFMWQYGGGQFSTLVNMRIWSGRTGVLPEQMGFSINQRNMGGDAFINGNGILINNYQAYGYQGGGYAGGVPGYGAPGYGAPGYGVPGYGVGTPGYGATGTPTLQITTQFVDVCRSIMNVQVRYQSVIILSGQMTGTVQFSNPYGYGGGYGAGGYPPGYMPGQPYAGGYPGMPGYAGANIPAQCYMNQQFVQQQPVTTVY